MSLNLNAVAQALDEIEGIRECHVVTSPNNKAIVFLVLDRLLSRDHILNILAPLLGQEQLQLVAVNDFPRNERGVIDTAALLTLPNIGDQWLKQQEAALCTRSGIEKLALIESAQFPRQERLYLADHLDNFFCSQPTQASEHDVPDQQLNHASTLPLAQANGSAIDARDGFDDLGQALQALADSGVVFDYINAKGDHLAVPVAQLRTQALRIGSSLAKLGLQAGQPVFIQAPENHEFFALVWGCIACGVIPIPTATVHNFQTSSAQLERLFEAIQLFEAPVVLTGTNLSSAVGAACQTLSSSVQVFDFEHLNDTATELLPWRTAWPQDAAMLLLTSGSTGQPKMVPLTHGMLLARSRAARDVNQMGASDISLNWMPLDHVAGLVLSHMRDVIAGCRQIHVDKAWVLDDPLRWIDLLDQYRVTITFAPNFAYGLVMAQQARFEQKQWDLSCLRTFINGGEAVVAATARAFLLGLSGFGLPAICMKPAWGMSETTSGITINTDFRLDNTSDDDSSVNVGDPVPGAQIRIVDHNDAVLNEEQIGRIQVSGPMIFSGYWGQTPHSSEYFTADGWFKTGDLGFLSKAHLSITGREKDVIIINGLNYSGAGIEAVVDGLPNIDPSFTAACAVHADGSSTESLAVFFVPVKQDDDALRQLMLAITEQINARFGISPNVLVPVTREDIPKTGIGKIQRRKIKQRFDAGDFDHARRLADLLRAHATNTLPQWFHRLTWQPRPMASLGRTTTLPKANVLFFMEDSALENSVKQNLIHAQTDTKHWHLISSLTELTDDVMAVEWNELVLAIEPEILSTELALGQWGTKLREWISLWQRTCFKQLTLVLRSATEEHSGDLQALTGLLESVKQEGLTESVRTLVLDHCVDTAVQQLRQELCATSKDSHISYREAVRGTNVLVPYPMPAQKTPSPTFRQGGRYVLIGGLGGVGRLLARHLVQVYDARVVVCGRTPLPELQARGQDFDSAHCQYLCTDITDPSHAKALVPQAQRLIGEVDALIHLAGTYQEVPLLQLSKAQIEIALAAKVQGAINLLPALHDFPQLKFIAFSSVTALIGGADNGLYALANGLLANVCDQWQTHFGDRVHCWHWSMWDSVGMSQDFKGRAAMVSNGIACMSEQQALASARLLGEYGGGNVFIGLDPGCPFIGRLAQMPVEPLWHILGFMQGEPAAFRELPATLEDAQGTSIAVKWHQLEAFPLGEDGEIDRSALGQKGRRPRSTLEAEVLRLWCHVLGIEQCSIDDSFFALGGSSLLAASFVAQLRDQFHCDCHVRDLFESPTVAGLMQSIQTESGHARFAIETVSREVPYHPTSFAQQRLWFLDQIGTGGVAYHVPVTLYFSQAINPEYLQKTLDVLIEQHESLRTVFPVIVGKPQQQILSPQPAVFTPVRVADRAQARDHFSKAAHHAFDLEQGPLWRMAYCTTPGEGDCVSFIFHHLIIDGWSLGVFLRDFSSLYRACQQGQSPELPPSPVHYLDYALWQRAQFQSEQLSEDVAWWCQHLSGCGSGTELALDYSRPEIPSSEGRRHTVSIPVGVVEKLDALSRQLEVSLFHLLLASYQLLLAQRTGDTDIRIGTVAANREHAQTQSLMGCFVNLLALRVDVSGCEDFIALLNRSRTNVIESLARQHVPFERIVEAMQTTRVLNLSPFFQLTFDLRDKRMTTCDLQGVELKAFETDLGTSKYDLSLTVDVQGQSYTSVWEYKTGLFSQETIATLAQDWLALLEQIAHEPRLRLSLCDTGAQVAAIDSFEVSRPAFEKGPAMSVPDVPVHHIIEQFAQRQPEALALSWTGGSMTYQVLNQYANVIAHKLLESGLKPHSTVGVCCEHSPALVASFLGILKAGCVFVPLDSKLPVARLTGMIEEAQIACVLHEGATTQMAGELGVQQTMDASFDQLDPSVLQSAKSPTCQVAPSDLAYIIFTSGSTGKPKGVLLEHGGLVNLMFAQAQLKVVEPDSRVIQFAAIGFDACVWEIFGALGSGACLVLGTQQELQPGLSLLQFMKAQAVSVATLVPSVLRVLPAFDLPALKTLVSAGEACSPSLVNQWGKGRRFINAYGPTEATVCATLSVCELPCTTVPDIGQPLPNVVIRILDEHLQPVPAGQPGELYIGGKGLARGYLHRPDLTEERFIPDPEHSDQRLYRSGDSAKWTECGKVEYIGRVDRQVKVRGHRIEQDEVEAVLQMHPAISAAAVQVEPDARGEPALMAYYVAQFGVAQSGRSAPKDSDKTTIEHTAEAFNPHDTSSQGLKRWCEQHLPEYMVPSEFRALDIFPRTSSDKVDRQALSSRYQNLQQAARGNNVRSSISVKNNQTQLSHSHYQGNTEHLLQQIWQEVLGHDQFGRTDNFFDVGGHSLRLVEVQSRLFQALNQTVEIVQLFKYVTIARLADYLDGLTAPYASPHSAPQTSDAEQSSESTKLKHSHYNRLKQLGRTQRAARQKVQEIHND